MSLSYDYMPKVLQALDLISQGRTRTSACDELNINIATFEDYVERVPMLQNLLVVAERRGYDAMAEALLEIDNHKVYGQSDSKMAKVISDNIKWLLDKRDKRYKERQQVDINMTADKAIIAALHAGKKLVEQRVLAAPSSTVIDVEAVEVLPAPATEDDALMAHILS